MVMSDPYVVSLEEKLAPAHTALVVIDYQNDFVSDNGAFEVTGTTVAGCRAIVPALKEIIESARKNNVRVVFVQSEYTTADNRYLSRVFLHQARRTHNGRYHEVPVCEPGSWGWDFYGDIRPVENEAVVVKHRFSAFHATDLDVILRSWCIQTIVTTGVMTSGCVESTVRDAFFSDYFVVVPPECSGAQDVRLHEGALERMDRLYGEVTSAQRVMEVWDRYECTEGLGNGR